MEADNKNPRYFLDLIRQSRRGKFKIYIGMSPGVGKTYRMLQEAHSLFRNGIDVRIACIETHGRPETEELLEGLPEIREKIVYYKGKQLKEPDVAAIIQQRPEVVLIDELAHSNPEGSRNEKRWQDVNELLEAGISVISALNIQHIESLNERVKSVTGILVTERVPDKVIGMADELVNVDLTVDDLITRLKEGKIYTQDKVETALSHFFKKEHLLQLRELALKEVASHVIKKVDAELLKASSIQHERILACIGSDAAKAKNVIRKTARLANLYTGQWYVLYVQEPNERSDRIPLDKQRLLINNFKLATELGAKVIQVKSRNLPDEITAQAIRLKATTVCIGKPRLSLLKFMLSTGSFSRLLKNLSEQSVDLIVVS